MHRLLLLLLVFKIPLHRTDESFLILYPALNGLVERENFRFEVRLSKATSIFWGKWVNTEGGMRSKVRRSI